MRTLRSQTHWMLALFSGFCLVAAAVTMAQRPGPDIQPPVVAHDELELSSVFRNVARKALPCVVTIETSEQMAQVDGNGEGGEDFRHPFEDLFGNDPRFRDMFRNMPRGPIQRRPRMGMGSGFIIDESGIIVTNNHVVADADRITVRLHDGREFIGKDVRRDPRTDLAVLKIDVEEKLSTLKFGDSDAIEVGDWVMAVGNPLGNELSVTSGIISAKGRGPDITEREDFLQTDAAINPGNSGGPLLNLHGEVIGINTAIASRTGGSDGIGFAIPSHMAWWVVNQLVKQGEVKRAYLGVAIQEVTSDLAKEFKLKPGQGAIVLQVIEDSPGATAKLQAGDIVLSLNGSNVTSPRSLQAIVEQLEVGKTYDLQIQRDGRGMTLPIVPKEMPNEYSLSSSDTVVRPEKPREEKDTVGVEKYGFEVRSLTEESAEQLGVALDAGVLVTSVDPRGAAARALTPGDLIVRVGNQPITNADDFQAALDAITEGRGLVMLVRNGNSRRFVVINQE